MNLGIITFHDANNYGAVLQAYALNKTLNKYCSCNIINYYNPYFHRHEINKTFKQKITGLIYGKKEKEKNIKFNLFRKDYLNIKDSYLNNHDLKKIVDDYDYVISGSDQVWNLKCSGNNDAYFLDFIEDNNKKISFSASFGTNNPILDDKHIEFIKSFNKISVREKTGYAFLNNKRINVKQTCDPVFLLKEEEWNKLTTNCEEDYILIYEVVNGNKMIDFAKELSRKTGLKIKIITSSNKPILGLQTVRDAGPLDWLTLFKNAKYVVTNSFHGLAFSLIFNKQFFVEYLTNSDSNTRMAELLDLVKLNDRIISDSNSEYNLINYKSVNAILEVFRNDSISYLESIVGDKNE